MQKEPLMIKRSSISWIEDMVFLSIPKNPKASMINEQTIWPIRIIIIVPEIPRDVLIALFAHITIKAPKIPLEYDTNGAFVAVSFFLRTKVINKNPETIIPIKWAIKDDKTGVLNAANCPFIKNVMAIRTPQRNERIPYIFIVDYTVGLSIFSQELFRHQAF